MRVGCIQQRTYVLLMTTQTSYGVAILVSSSEEISAISCRALRVFLWDTRVMDMAMRAMASSGSLAPLCHSAL